MLIENIGTGAKRTVTADSTGRFQATSLPVGDYRVQLIRDGKVNEGLVWINKVRTRAAKPGMAAAMQVTAAEKIDLFGATGKAALY